MLVDYPFGITAKLEDPNLSKARQILDDDHYGMKKIKQRILEFLSVSIIKGEFRCIYSYIH